jgi:hypothetical protein
MPFVLEEKEVENIPGTNKGVEIPLTEDQKKEVVFHKYVSTNELLSDIQPGVPWREQIITDIPFGSRNKPRITLGERGVAADDGLVIDIEGRPDGVFGYIDNLYRTEEETDTWEENTGQEAVRCVRWGFRITRILKTNGPELRERHFRTMEEKAEQEKAEMFHAVAAAMKAGVSSAEREGRPVDPQSLLDGVTLEQLEKELAARKTKK